MEFQQGPWEAGSGSGLGSDPLQHCAAFCGMVPYKKIDFFLGLVVAGDICLDFSEDCKENMAFSCARIFRVFSKEQDLLQTSGAKRLRVYVCSSFSRVMSLAQ